MSRPEPKSEPSSLISPAVPPFLVPALLTLVLVVALWPLIIGSRELVYDARDMGYPTLTFLADALVEWRIPLWDPYTSCGYPFHADPNNPILSPLALVLGVLFKGNALGALLYTLVCWAMAAFGAWFWAKNNDATPAGALVSGVTFACGGFFVGHGQHTGFLLTLGFMPWCFAFSERAVRTGRASDTLFAAGFLALSAGGYSFLSFFMALVLTAWLLLRARAGELDSEPPGFTRARLLRILGPLCVSALLLCVYYSPVLYAFFTEGRGYTDRTSALSVDGAVNDNVFSPLSFFSFFFPYATLVSMSFLGTDISMANAYVGMLGLPLVGLWAFGGAKKRWWFFGLCVFMLILSLGGRGGLRTIVYYLVPPMRYMRHNGAFRVGWMMPVALGAGLGLSALQRSAALVKPVQRLLGVFFVSAIVVALVVSLVLSEHAVVAPFANLYLVPLLVIAVGFAVSAAVRKPALLGWALAALVCVDMAWHVHKNRKTVSSGEDSIARADAAHVRSTAIEGEPSARLPPEPFGRFNLHQITKQSVAVGYTGMRSVAFNDRLTKSPFVGFLTLPFRAWLSPGVEAITSEESALSILLGSGPLAPAPALVESVPSGVGNERVIAGSYGRVQTTHYAPERVDMRVEVPGTTPALLVTTERFGGLWQAYVDDAPAKVVRTNLFFRGVWVPPGSHAVRWEYRAPVFLALLAVSFAALIASFGAALWLRRRSS